MYNVCVLEDMKMDIHKFYTREEANNFFKANRGKMMITQEDERPFRTWNLKCDWKTVPFQNYTPEDQEFILHLQRQARWNKCEDPSFMMSVDINLGITELYIREIDKCNNGADMVTQFVRDFYGHGMKAMYLT